MSQQYASQQPSGFKNHITKVAIVGVSGHVGKYITEALLATGKHTLTAITRQDSKALVPQGVTAARVNYDDPKTIVDALKGQDFFIITMGAFVPPETHNMLVDAAAAAGVKWVMPNEYGIDATAIEFSKKSVIGPKLLAQREHIASKGLNYIGLVSGFWYQHSIANDPACYGFDFANKKLTLVEGGDAVQSVSTWSQNGRAVAAALSLPILPERPGDESKGPFLDQFRNGSLYVHSFVVSQKDMFAAVLRALGDKESDWTVTEESAEERWQRGMDAMGKGDMSGFILALYAPSFSGDKAADFSAKSHIKLLGLHEEDIDKETKVATDMVKEGWSYWK